MLHTLSLLKSTYITAMILKNGCSSNTGFLQAYGHLVYAYTCKNHHVYGSFVQFTCALSYDIAICDVSAGCLTGPDDLHNLSTFEAIVPRNGIRNLYSRKLFCSMHSEESWVTCRGCHAPEVPEELGKYGEYQVRMYWRASKIR